jgi:integrase/recombinase XerC
MDQARARFIQYLNRCYGQSTTPKCYTSDLDIFLRTIDDKAPEAVTAVDVDTFIDSQLTDGLSSTTITRRLATIHTFFEYLASECPEQNWPNPVIWRRHKLKRGMHLPRDAPEDEVERLFAVINTERDRAMFSLMLGAGLRVAEVATLRLDNLEAPAEPGRLAKLRVCGKRNKERTVWLTPSLWQTLQAWFQVRPENDSEYFFLSQRGRPISVAGVQYRLRHHCRVAGVYLTCHQLRHTFSRRMVENGLPVDSLARLLGHNDLQSTQRYIDGADPTVRDDFAGAMSALEATLNSAPKSLPDRSKLKRSSRVKEISAERDRSASRAELKKLRKRLVAIGLPDFLEKTADAYLSWRWPVWRAQTAYQVGTNILCVIRRVWTWLEAHRQITSWESFRRADLQAWLEARCQSGVSHRTIQTELGILHSLFKFVETHDDTLDPGLFRVQAPRQQGTTLPRYLSEANYRRLESIVLQATESDSNNAGFDRAWFLTLAHTGVRVSELLALRLEDLDLEAGRATVRCGKLKHDRVVYLTPILIEALKRYLALRPEIPNELRVFVLHERSPTDRTIRNRLAQFGQRAGVHVYPHMLRHTIATRLVNQGMPTQSLRKLLGHQNLRTTQLYAQIYDETLYRQFKDAMSSLEAIEVSDWPLSSTESMPYVEVGGNKAEGTSLKTNLNEDTRKQESSHKECFAVERLKQTLDDSI